MCMQLLLCQWQNWQTAEPKPADCHSSTFSEGRAMQTVEKLANDLPHRQVGAEHGSPIFPTSPAMKRGG